MRQIFKKTEKTFVASLPRYAYTGKIVVIQSESEAIKAVQVLAKSSILGIDTETRPTFRKGESHKVALLQVANEELCFLFRINEMGFLPCLVQLLSSPNILKVGLSLKDDFMMLRQRDSKFVPAGYIDLQNYVKDMDIEDMSLQKIYANIFHMRISKNAQLSNWEADVLTETQKVYAATDAVTCIQLYKELKHLKETKTYEIVG